MSTLIVLFTIGVSLMVFVDVSQQSWPGGLIHNCSNAEEQVRNEAVHRVVAGLPLTSVILYTEFQSGDFTGVLNMISSLEVRLVILSNFYGDAIDDIYELHDLADRLHLVVCPADCVGAIIHKVRSFAPEKFLFSSRWLIVTNSSLPLTLADEFINFAYMYPKMTTGCSVELMTLELSGNNRVFRSVKGINVCQEEKYFSLNYEKSLFPNLNLGFHGRTILVGLAEWNPYVKKETDGTGPNYTGLGIVILEEMAHYLNFRIKYVDLNDDDYKWSKLFKMLRNKELDILACPLMISPERGFTMDFTYPVSINTLQAYYKIPDETDLRWRLLVDLLSWPALVLTVVSLLCTAFVLGTFQSIHSSEKCPCADGGFIPIHHLQLDVGWFLFGNLMKQGQCTCAQEAMSTRLVVAAWCVFCLVLTITVTAYLVPALGVVKQPVLFHSVEDLLNQDEYKWGFYGDEGLLNTSLKYTSPKSQEDLYSRAVYFNSTDSEVMSPVIDVHKRKMLNEKYVFFGSVDEMHSFKTYHCNLESFGNLVQFPVAFATPKHSPFTPLFSQWIVNFYENGLMEKWKREWYPASNCSFKRTKSEPLTLRDLQSVFILLAYGAVFSLAVLGFEIACYWLLRKRGQTKSKSFHTRTAMQSREEML